MDKSTLSNYGWIVIACLVLCVMIALASPFGYYIEDAVQNTTQGLFDVEQKAMDAASLILPSQAFEDNTNSTLITFTINDLTNKIYALEYQAEEGMTWEDWLASKYNTDSYVFENTSIYLDSGNNTQTLLTSNGHYDEITIIENSLYNIINPKIVK